MLGDTTVSIEVVGTCNLRCPSCPVGNYGEFSKAGNLGGKMPIERFRAILDKLERELKPREHDVFVALYSWGEPLIHPQIEGLIREAKRRGFRVGLSSNLNYGRNLDAAVLAEPDEFVISLSGFTGDVYRATHAGGDVERVKANMRHLARAISEGGGRTRVFVHYHTYRHNAGGDLLEMAALCDRLRFDFVPGIAYYMPVEKMLGLADGRVDPGDRQVLENLLVAPDVQLKIAGDGSGTSRCDLLENRLDIDVDGAVKLCCSSFERTHNVAPDFLDVSLAEIQRERQVAELCDPCMRHGIYRIYTLQDHARWRAAANETLGQLGYDIRFIEGGIDAPGLRTETCLQLRTIDVLNRGELAAAASLKRELDACVARKYGRPMDEPTALSKALDVDSWRRGYDLPQDPLRYYFIGGVLDRNLHNRPRKAQDTFARLLHLAEPLTRDRDYLPVVEDMRGILATWHRLPA